MAEPTHPAVLLPTRPPPPPQTAPPPHQPYARPSPQQPQAQAQGAAHSPSLSPGDAAAGPLLPPVGDLDGLVAHVMAVTAGTRGPGTGAAAGSGAAAEGTAANAHSPPPAGLRHGIGPNVRLLGGGSAPAPGGGPGPGSGPPQQGPATGNRASLERTNNGISAAAAVAAGQQQHQARDAHQPGALHRDLSGGRLLHVLVLEHLLATGYAGTAAVLRREAGGAAAVGRWRAAAVAGAMLRRQVVQDVRAGEVAGRERVAD